MRAAGRAKWRKSRLTEKRDASSGRSNIVALHGVQADPRVVHPHELGHNLLLDLDNLPARPDLAAVGLPDPEPALARLLHKYNLVLALRQRVANHDLVPVPLQRRSRLGDQQRRVGLQLAQLSVDTRDAACSP